MLLACQDSRLVIQISPNDITEAVKLSNTTRPIAFTPRPDNDAASMALSVDQKRLKATKFPPEFDTKVDIQKVNIDLMKKWIAGKITDILGDEDDVVVETCYNMIEQDQYVRAAAS